MIVRSLAQSDIEELKRIHEKFFSEQFEFPEFSNKFLGAFVITEDNGTIIVGGGVRPIAESILITNKDCNPFERVKALKETTLISSYICSVFGFTQLHCFIQDDIWKRHLLRSGFEPIKGDGLVLVLK